MSESSPQLIEVGSNVANNDQLLSILQVQPSDGNSNEVGVPIQLVQGGEEIEGQEALILQPQSIEVNGERHVILQQTQDPNTGELLVFLQGENGEAITLSPEALSGGLVQVSGEGNDQVLTLALPQDGEAGSLVVVTEPNAETSATGVISGNTSSINNSRILTNIPSRESTHTSLLPSSSLRSSSSSYPSTFTAGTTLVQSVETPRVSAHQIDSTSSTIDLNVSNDKAINQSTNESYLHPLITAVNSITESKSKGVEIPRKLTVAEAFDKAVLGKEINLDDRSHSFTKSSVSNKELKLASKNLLSSIKSGHSSNSTNYDSVIQVEESENSAPLEALIANTVVSGGDNNYVIMTTNEEGGLPTEINLAEVLNANSASGQTFFLQTSKGLVACTATTAAEDGSIQFVTDSSGNASVITGEQNHEQNLDSQVIQSLSGSQTLAYTLSSTTSGIELTPVTNITSNYGSKNQTCRGNKNSRQSKSKTLTMLPGGETLLLPSRASLSTPLSSQASSSRKRNASRSTSSVSVTITPTSISSPIIPVQPDAILTSNDAFSHISKSSSSLSNTNDISLLTGGIPGVSQLAASRRTYSKKNNILWLNPDQAAITSSSKSQNDVSNSSNENFDTVTQASNKAASSSGEKGKSKNETLSFSKIGNWSEKLKTSMEVTLVDKPPPAVSPSQKSTKDSNLTSTTISFTETSANKGKSETSTLNLPLKKKLTEVKLNTKSKSANEVVQDTKSDFSKNVVEKTASSTSSSPQKLASNINIVDTATTTTTTITATPPTTAATIITNTKSPRKDKSSVVIIPKEDEAKDKLDVSLTSLNKSPIKSTADEKTDKLDQSSKSLEKVPSLDLDKSKTDSTRSEKLSTVQSIPVHSSVSSPSNSKKDASNNQAKKETSVKDEINNSPPKSNSNTQWSKKDENVNETKASSPNTNKDSKSELKGESEESKGKPETEIISKKASRSNSQNKEVDLKRDDLEAHEDDKSKLSNSSIKSTRSTRLKTDSVKKSKPNSNESTVDVSSSAAVKRKESKILSNDEDKSQSNKKSYESIDNDKTKTNPTSKATDDISLTSKVNEESCNKLLKSTSIEKSTENEFSYNDDHSVSKNDPQSSQTKSDSTRKRQTRLESSNLKNSKLSPNEGNIKENDANDEKEGSLPKMARSKVTRTESRRKRHSDDVNNSSQESNLDVENFSSPVKKRVGFNLPSGQDQASNKLPKNEKTPKSKKLIVNKSSSQPFKLTPIIKYSSTSSSSPEMIKKERVSLVVSYGSCVDGNEEKSQLRKSVTSLSDLRSSSEFYDFDSSECSFHVRHQTSNLVSFTPRGSGGNYTCQKCGYRTSRMNNLVLHHKDQCPVVKDAVRLHWQNEINKQTKRHAEKSLSESKLVIKKKKRENNFSSFSSSFSSSSSSPQLSSLSLSKKFEEADFGIENEESEEDSVFNNMDNKALGDVKESIQVNLESNLLNQSDDEEELANRKNSEYKKRYGYCESEVVWAEVNSVHWPALVTKVNESCKNVTLRFIECPFSRKSTTVLIEKAFPFDDAERNKQFLKEGKATHGDSIIKAVQKAEDYSRKKCLGDESGAAKLFGSLNVQYVHTSDDEKGDEECGLDNHEEEMKDINMKDTNLKFSLLDSDPNDDYLDFHSSESIAQLKERRRIQNAKLLYCVKEGKVENHLLGVYRETIPSDRHQKFKCGSDAEKCQLKHVPWFGPIDDEDQQEEIYDYCSQLFKANFKPDGNFDTVAYLFEVWVPEAIVKAISRIRRKEMDEAEAIFSKGVILSKSEKDELEKEILKETEKQEENSD